MDNVAKVAAGSFACAAEIFGFIGSYRFRRGAIRKVPPPVP